MMPKKVAVFRKEHFNAAHRLNNPNWSDEKNERVYGKCNNYNYHGHNYDLIVQVTGEVNPETGYVMDMKILSDTVKERNADFKHDFKVQKEAVKKSLENIGEEFKSILPNTSVSSPNFYI